MERRRGELLPFEIDRRDEPRGSLVERASFHQGPPAGLLVVFPGRHYGPEAPLLRGPIEALIGEGWDVLVASYREVSGSGGGDPILARARQALDRAVPRRGYRRIGLLGKSMGTPYVAELCVDEASLGPARAVYLTPLIGSAEFEGAFVRSRQAAYLALGTADPFYSAEALADLKRRRAFQLTVIEGADHGMNVPGDPDATEAAVARVAGEAVSFLTT
ncbi:MAG: hypothetical protein ACRDHY_12400 [Anaerolineales bacterium]